MAESTSFRFPVETDKAIDKLVARGVYASRTQVVLAGLRLLLEGPVLPETWRRLEAAARAGGKSEDEVLDSLLKRAFL